MRTMYVVCRSMISRARSITGASCDSARRRAALRTPESGLRSSCARTARNSFLPLSRSRSAASVSCRSVMSKMQPTMPAASPPGIFRGLAFIFIQRYSPSPRR